jgi:RHS repeat-associated protein
VAALLSATVLSTYILPSGAAFAETLPSDNTPSVATTPGGPIELKQLRTPYSETFYNPNGTYTTHIFTAPRFYKDDQGSYRPIDLGLAPTTRAGFAYENQKNLFQSNFAQTLGKGATVSLSSGSESVGFSPIGASAVAGVPSGSSISYPAAFPGADLTYQELPGAVKESIVLHSASAPTSFSFDLSLTGLTAKTSGNAILLQDSSGKTVFKIPAPTMIDAKGHFSTDVTMALSGSTLTITPSQNFLSTATYPVTIDPSVTGGAGNDTWISQSYPNTNYSTSPYDEVGYTPSYGITRSLIQFPNLPNLLPGASYSTITSAYLQMYQDNASESDPINIYRISSSWDPNSVDWSNQPSNTGVLVDQESQNAAGTGVTGNWQFWVTASIKNMYKASVTNYGFMLTDANESTTSNYAEFYSLNNSNQNELPQLVINYSVSPVGSEPFWTQDAHGVNPANGNLSLGFTDLSTPGLGDGFSVSRTYNSLLPTLPNHTNLFGAGFTSNLDMSIADSGHGPIVFTDANGLQHIFAPTSGGNSGYVGPVGEHLTLTLTGSEPSVSQYSVSEENGTEYVFNDVGALAAIKTPTAGGNYASTTLNYNTSGQLTSITDPSGRTWTVTLNASGQIASIQDPAGRKATYTYSSGDLTQVQVTGAATSDSTDTSTTTVDTYSYGTNGLLASATDAASNTTSYAYNASNQISQVTNPLGGIYTYAYGTISGAQNQTQASASMTVTDPNGNAVEYETNAQGNTVAFIQDPGSSPHLNLTTSYSYDVNDQLTSMTTPNGNTTNFSYDPGGNGLPTATTYPNKYESTQSYTPLTQPSGQNNPNGANSGTHYSGAVPVDSYNSSGNDSMVNPDQNGQVTSASSPEGLGSSLVPNSTFALTTTGGTGILDWTTYSGTLPTLVTSPTPPFGKESVEIQSGSSLTNSAYIPVTPGSGYNLSDFVSASSLTPSGGYGAYLNVFWFKNASGTPSSQKPETSYLSNLTGPTSSGTGTTWIKQATQISAPTDANYAEVQIVVAGTGAAYYDGVSLSPVANNPNLLLNSSFLDTVPNTQYPDNWQTNNLTLSDGLDTSTTHAGYISQKITGSSAGAKGLQQDVPAPQYGVGGYLLSGWSENTGATAPSGSVTYDLQLQAVYADGSTTTMTTQNFSAASGWQQVSQVVGPPAATDGSGSPLTALRVKIDYGDQTGTAWFADVRLLALPLSSSASNFDLMQNPAFETDLNGGALPDFWQNASGTGAGTATWSTDTSFAGTHSLKLVPSTGTGATTTIVSSTPVTLTGQVTPLTLVGYIHTSGLSSDSAYLQVVVKDGSGTVLGTWDSQKLGSSTAVDGQVPWTRVSVSIPSSAFSASDPPASAVVSLMQDPDASGSSGASYFDNILLTQGDLFTHYGYDTKDNYVTSATDQLGNTTSMTPDANTGDVASVTDPNGHVTSFSYDKYDDILSTTVPYQATIGGAVQNETYSYGYDANGNLTSATAPNGAQVSYTYNGLGEPLTYKETMNGTPLTTSYTYDKAGRLTQVSYPNGNTETLSYDAANRLSGTSSTNGTTTQTYGTGYDANSNVTSVSSNGTTTANFGYDSLDRLTSVTEPVSGVNDTQTLTLDPQGNPTSIAFAIGSTTSWTDNYSWTIGSQLFSLSDTVGTRHFEYTPQGSLQKMLDGVTGAQVSYGYDGDHRVNSAVGSDGTGTQILNQGYAYNAAGNLTSVADNIAGKTYTFTYDSQNQLVQEQAPDGHTYTYTYDALGNRLSVQVDTNPKTTYTYDTEGNRLTSVGAASLTYDSAGNLLSDGTNTYTWNPANQLTQVQYGTHTDTYTYDALGRRITKNGYGIHYFGKSTEVAYVTNTSNAFSKSFTYNGQGLPQTMTMAVANVGNLTYTFVYDGLGNLVGMIDDNQTINAVTNPNFGKEVVTYTYDAWGNVLSTTDTSGYNAGAVNPFRYKGYWYDAGTGLYYLNARYYNPKWGRFISEDPAAINAGDVASFNAYEYGKNSPLVFSDPTGMFGELALAGAGSIGDVLGDVIAGVVGAALAPEVLTAVAVGAVVIGAAWGVSKLISWAGKRPWNELPTTGSHPFNPPLDKAGKPLVIPGPKRGRVDANNNEWTWDKGGERVGNPHWDVTHPNGSHTNVNPQSSNTPGEVNHGQDNFGK